MYKTDQLITVSVSLENEEEFFSTFVYATNEVDDMKQLWEDLCHHHGSPLFQNKAWMIMGDFNEILEVGEHSGGDSLIRVSNGTRDFQRMALHCRLSDMGY